MYKYTSKNESGTFSLHDCRATNMRCAGKDLIIEFSDGFWIVGSSTHNPHKDTMRTSASAVRFVNFEAETIYIYKTVRLFGKSIMTKRTETDLQTLIEKVNSGVWKPEFIDEYACFNKILFNCQIFKGKGRPFECQFAAYCTDMEYSWNDIREDRVW